LFLKAYNCTDAPAYGSSTLAVAERHGAGGKLVEGQDAASVKRRAVVSARCR
jgi:hypothetical protein